MPLLVVGVRNKQFFFAHDACYQPSPYIIECRMPDYGIENLLCVLKKLHRSRGIQNSFFRPKFAEIFFCFKQWNRVAIQKQTKLVYKGSGLCCQLSSFYDVEYLISIFFFSHFILSFHQWKRFYLLVNQFSFEMVFVTLSDWRSHFKESVWNRLNSSFYYFESESEISSCSPSVLPVNSQQCSMYLG